MSPSSAWHRPLQIAAVALGIVIAAQCWLLSQRERPAPVDLPAAGAPADGGSAVPAANPVDVPPAAHELENVAPAPQPAAPREPPPPQAAVLFGTLRHSDGTPVDNGTIRLRRDGRSLVDSRLHEGGFAFAGLLAGDYQIETQVQDAVPLRRDVRVDAPRTRLDLQLDANWMLQVDAVATDGRPLAEAVGSRTGSHLFLHALRAHAFVGPAPDELPATNGRVPCAGTGTWCEADAWRGSTLPKRALGVLTLPPGQAVYVGLFLRHALIAQEAVPVGQPAITFRLPVGTVLAELATVRLRLVDEAGAPLADANITAIDALNHRGARSGADGRVVLDHVLPGWLDLMIVHRRGEGPPIQIRVDPRADLDLGDLVLQPLVEVKVEFAGAGRRNHVRFAWLDAPRGTNCRPTVRDSRMPSNEQTQTLWLHPGRSGLVFRDADRVAIVEVDTRELPPRPIRLEMVPGAPLSLKNLHTVARTAVNTRSGLCLVDLAGLRDEYSIGLPPGAYELEVTGWDDRTTTRALQLGAGGAVITLP
jgi:hypothetical protein